MKKTVFVLVIGVLALAACSSGGDRTESTETRPMETGEKKNDDTKGGEANPIDLAAHRNNQTTAISDAYKQIRNALADADSTKAATGATALLAAFEKFDAAKLTESQRKEYLEILEDAKEQAEHIEKSELAHQKEHFETLTEDIRDLFALVGPGKEG